MTENEKNKLENKRLMIKQYFEDMINEYFYIEDDYEDTYTEIANK